MKVEKRFTILKVDQSFHQEKINEVASNNSLNMCQVVMSLIFCRNGLSVGTLSVPPLFVQIFHGKCSNYHNILINKDKQCV